MPLTRTTKGATNSNMNSNHAVPNSHFAAPAPPDGLAPRRLLAMSPLATLLLLLVASCSAFQMAPMQAPRSACAVSATRITNEVGMMASRVAPKKKVLKKVVKKPVKKPIKKRVIKKVVAKKIVKPKPRPKKLVKPKKSKGAGTTTMVLSAGNSIYDAFAGYGGGSGGAALNNPFAVGGVLVWVFVLLRYVLFFRLFE